MKKIICKILGHKYEVGLYQLSPEVLKLNIPCSRCKCILRCENDGFGGFNIRPLDEYGFVK